MPSEFSLIFNYIWEIIRTWWWVVIPFILWQPAVYFWLWWREELFLGKQNFILLEIKLPKETLKPIKAMEEVFAGFHAIHDVFVFREKWIEGLIQLSISCEIVSLGGETHFYIRTPEIYRNIIESNIYSQYPEAEISLAKDYTRNVPQNIPNKDWDVWGCDFINSQEDVYPIKTYPKFETEREAEEEKRVDPLAGLLDGMATIGPGEQIWLQFIATPVRDEIPWRKRGRELADKIARRKAVTPLKPMAQEAAEILITGKTPGEEVPEEKEIIPPEMKLTPGEREILAAVEEKISKFAFICNVRFFYIGKRDVFFKPRGRFVFGFFKEVSTENLGGLKIWKDTMTKVKSASLWFLDERRLYLRKRKLLRLYRGRLTPLFPREGGTYVLNTAELATLYHFPSRIVAPAPGVLRAEAKRGEAPPEIPLE
jgi:hypothetical protein